MFRMAFLAFTVISLIGCGSAANGPASVAAPIAGKPDVVITFDGANHGCVVALFAEPQGSTLPCAELVPFLKDELRLPSGSIYDTRMAANPDAAEVAKTTRTLNEAGYRFIGGH